jgi:hypothetical protein
MAISRDFLFAKPPDQLLGSIDFFIHSIPEYLYKRMKYLRCEADHSSVSGVEIKDKPFSLHHTSS